MTQHCSSEVEKEHQHQHEEIIRTHQKPYGAVVIDQDNEKSKLPSPPPPHTTSPPPPPYSYPYNHTNSVPSLVPPVQTNISTRPPLSCCVLFVLSLTLVTIFMGVFAVYHFKVNIQPNLPSSTQVFNSTTYHT